MGKVRGAIIGDVGRGDRDGVADGWTDEAVFVGAVGGVWDGGEGDGRGGECGGGADVGTAEEEQEGADGEVEGHWCIFKVGLEFELFVVGNGCLFYGVRMCADCFVAVMWNVAQFNK